MRNKILCADCIEALNNINEPFVDLVFADPPFNIGYEYDKYYDKVKSKNYIAWTKEWMTACKKALKSNGSFYIAIGDDYAANVKIIADEIGLYLRNWIIWHYTFGQQTKNKFARSHTHIFYFVCDKEDFTFNDWALRVPSDRQLIYNDKRANPKGKMPDDVWTEFSRVCGTFNEREGWHPCQMPENLLKRVVSASSNPGDLVLDPFSGSGTTAAAAVQLGRDYLGIEISADYVKKSTARLRGLSRKKTDVKKQVEEIRRLLIDMSIPARKILADDNLLEIFGNQLAIRLNGQGRLDNEQLVSALGELTV